MLEIVDAKNTTNYRNKKHRNIGILENIIVEYLKNYKGEYYICSFEKIFYFGLKKYLKI